MLHELQVIINLYEKRGFNFVEVKADLEFQCLEMDIKPTILDLLAADDHVGEIERSNRTSKSDLRTLTQGLPFPRLTRLMVEEAIRFVIKSRNQFAASDGIFQVAQPHYNCNRSASSRFLQDGFGIRHICASF